MSQERLTDCGLTESELAESRKRALVGAAGKCNCLYNGPQWINSHRCAHCGGTLPMARINREVIR